MRCLFILLQESIVFNLMRDYNIIVILSIYLMYNMCIIIHADKKFLRKQTRSFTVSALLRKLYFF